MLCVLHWTIFEANCIELIFDLSNLDTRVSRTRVTREQTVQVRGVPDHHFYPCCIFFVVQLWV